MVRVIENIELAINPNGDTRAARTGTDGEAATSKVWATNQATNIAEAKGLTACHAIEVVINSGTKLIRGTTIGLTKSVDEDVNKNVMTPGWAVEIIKGGCDNSEDTGTIKITARETTREVVDSVLWAVWPPNSQ